ncbi:protein FAR1-RELATED SEQUENCE 5-like [Salvia splendens]|uniref:protein FAR1-RELATED SEQUENCE 5-like n=1 Tax=Salvia splendens TaxID=180675 RepID=UPI001C277376|nr:protein FAR1-RELATED SEQUENCE 5-like [Salvia splendens]
MAGETDCVGEEHTDDDDNLLISIHVISGSVSKGFRTMRIIGKVKSVMVDVADGNRLKCDSVQGLEMDGMSKGYEVCQFVEYHNHLMVADEHRHFMTANRSLDPIHRRFMEDCGRYCMIFAPFTGKDNHSRAVTFGAGLLSSEGRDSYAWLFGCFVRCMGVAPKLIITDQDWGMKLVVQQVLLQTRHRWCMWHIMVKVSDKLPKSLLGNEDFKKELNACVWSDLLQPDEFDIIWNDIMERYGLEDVHWFGSMFEDREFWVPAYFQDFPMRSLLRTTSMSESENSFFKNYTKPRANLVQFINFFNYAVGDQRNVNSRLNYLDYSTIPDLSTQLPIEKHASTIYTDSIFKHVQQEISMVCEIVSITVEDNIKMHKANDQYDRTWDVKYDCKQDTFDCSCKKFSRIVR